MPGAYLPDRVATTSGVSLWQTSASNLFARPTHSCAIVPFSRGEPPTSDDVANPVRTAARGPLPVATPEQVERVLQLDAAGSSLRAIAQDVFGDRKMYDRVWRLLRSTRAKTTDELAVDQEVTDALAGLDGDDALAGLEELVREDA
jgi:hypothetical protein